MINLKKTLCTAISFLLIFTSSLPAFSETSVNDVNSAISASNAKNQSESSIENPYDYENPEIKVIDENSNNKKIELHLGQMLNIKLESHTSEGYMWVEEDEDPSANISLTQLRSFEDKSNDNDTISYSNFVYIAKNECSNMVKRFKCVSSTGDKILKTITFTISISQPETLTLFNKPFTPCLYLRVGQKLKIVLDSNATTGCRWNYKTQLDNKVLKEINSYYVSIPCQSQIAGSGGYQYFIFEAVESGNACIDLEYKQPWDKENPPYNTFTMRITVDPVTDYSFPSPTPLPVTILSNEKRLTIGKNNNRQQVILTKGQILDISLPCDESGDYRWIYGKIPDNNMLREKFHEILYLDSLPYTALSHWEYTAINTGTTNIGFAYANTTNLSMQPKDFFCISVKVVDYLMPATPKPTNYISGTIKADVDSKSADINSSFMVEIVELGLTTTTDKNGNFSFLSLANDTNLTIMISKDNYLTRTIKNVSFNTILPTIDIWAGDILINGKSDGAINMADVVQVAKAFSSNKITTEFNNNCDLNCDGAINMSDIIIMAKHFNCTSNSYPNI
ncbi:protease inhibitor I42 family protein [Pseudobacteroides cellulosolvens]|uniref:Proteinase inhibitor I42, chagasin n=1 Tax=Pseudobacteroides cellulosolvens ATCC 35603 = DSM 2933 TaxID=398512 RepID=A0A0L6JNK1_9FIRM|nr:protease inhibitor I42 family protein [Pseudobacteroides cellulosolvens]KNY27310.1 Proteinase inhibitor I42, chagasin [Pseudobacteroides cellulosolvens ATCC 35603 = DSM 2933]